MKEQEHPLIVAVALKQKAQKMGAHPKIVARIQARISAIANETMETMRKSKYISEIIDRK